MLMQAGAFAPGLRLRELARYRELVANLTARDLRLKYKGSVLGVGWSLLNPLIMMAIYTAVFSVFLRVVVVPRYWALVLVGLLAWIFFSNAVTSATASFIRNPTLITKVYFPIESLSIANVLAHFINYLISLAALMVALLIGGVPLGPSLVLLPLILAATLAFTLGLALLLASVTVYLRDLEHVVPLALAAWFYVSPILYPLDPHALPRAAARYIGYLRLNPLAWYLDSFHAVLFYGRWPSGRELDAMMGSAVVMLAAGFLVFTWLRPRIPEEV